MLLRTHGRRGPGRLVALLGLLLPMMGQGQSNADLWRFVYPNSQAVISVNWQRIRQSPAVNTLRNQWLNTAAAQNIPGIELLDDIDRVVISSPGGQSDSDEAPMLIVLRGHFDPPTIRRFVAKLGAKPQTYNSFQVYRPQAKDAKDNAYVLFDANTLLFGDAAAVFAALDRNQFAPAAPEPGSLVARAAELADNYDLWMSIKPAELASDNRLVDLLRGGALASDSQAIEAGLSFRSGLIADISMHFGSEASAKQMVAEMVRLAAAASKDKSADPEVRQLERKLKFTADGAVAKIGLRLSAAELQTTARAFAKSHPAGIFTGDAVSEGAAPLNAALEKSAPPAKPAMIRIEGLDDGPREIPYATSH